MNKSYLIKFDWIFLISICLFTFTIAIYAAQPWGDNYAMHYEHCSDEKLGLKICIRLKDKKIKLNEDFELSLVFKNISKYPLRIYLVETEFFRSFQSYFYLLFNGKSKYISNISPPHGYIVTEADFHLVDPNSEIVFKHTLSIDETKIETDSNEIYLNWVYENKISKWEGDITTLDGPTKKLFGGKEIPYIWKGKVESKIALEIAKLNL